MKYDKFIIVALAILMLGLNTHAKESTIEKAETVKNKTMDSVKSSYRKVDDKVCETVNGKVNCIAKKIKNRSNDQSDKLKTDTRELINKVD